MEKLIEYKCPCCGGKIEYDSNSQKMKCPYCDTEFEIGTLRDYENDLVRDGEDDISKVGKASGRWSESEAEKLRTYVCHSCGGEIVTDSTTAASSCPFCGNPAIMQGQISGDLRPDLVIPFKLDKKAAESALLNHFKGKKLLPKLFKDENTLKEIKGVYVPFWIYDNKADANARYRATKLRYWSDSRYSYTETSHYSVVRSGNLEFSGVPVDGSSKMDDILMESIEPFDISEAVDFNTAYLSGYLADRYDVTSEESASRAASRMKKCCEDTFRSTVSGYASVIPESFSFSLDEGTVKYALYPVWLLNTEWKGKKYFFAMNGQTGKMVGDLPLDRAAYFKWLGGLTAAFSVISAALYLLFMIS